MKNFLFLILISLSSCVSVSPPDVIACLELSPSRGYCNYSISEKPFYIDDTNLYQGKTWWDLKPELILLPTSSWVTIKQFILDICYRNSRCSQSIQNKIIQFDKQVHRNNPNYQAETLPPDNSNGN